MDDRSQQQQEREVMEDVYSFAWNRAEIMVGASEFAAARAVESGTDNNLDEGTAYNRFLAQLEAYEPLTRWGPEALKDRGVLLAVCSKRSASSISGRRHFETSCASSGT